MLEDFIRENLRNRKYRTAIIGFFVITLLALIVLRLWTQALLHTYVVAQETAPILLGFADLTVEQLLLTFVVAGVVSIAAIVFLPEQPLPPLRLCPATRIACTLEDAWRNTDMWYLRGHTGKYFRNFTLPKLCAIARSSRATMDIMVTITQPWGEALEQYARYHSTVRDAKRSLAEHRSNLCATIIKCRLMKHECDWLRISVHLSPTVSTFRYDISEHVALMTKEAKDDPAVIAERGEAIYDWLKLEFEHHCMQCVRVEIRPLKSADTVEEIETALHECFNGFADMELNTELYALTLKRLQSAENDYAR